MRERAAQARAQFTALLERIPPGQPVLVGHHSEARHRRDLERMDALLKRVAEWERRADALEAAARREAARAQALREAEESGVEPYRPSDRVVVRWTHSYRVYEARAEVLGRTLNEWRVRLLEPVGGRGGWPSGHVLRIPAASRPRWSANNRIVGRLGEKGERE